MAVCGKVGVLKFVVALHLAIHMNLKINVLKVSVVFCQIEALFWVTSVLMLCLSKLEL